MIQQTYTAADNQGQGSSFLFIFQKYEIPVKNLTLKKEENSFEMFFMSMHIISVIWMYVVLWVCFVPKYD